MVVKQGSAYPWRSVSNFSKVRQLPDFLKYFRVLRQFIRSNFVLLRIFLALKINQGPLLRQKNNKGPLAKKV